MSVQTPPDMAPMDNPKAAAAAAKAYAKAERPWFKKKRFIIPGVVVVLAMIGGMSGGSDEDGPKLIDESTTSEVSNEAGTTGDPAAKAPAKKAPKAAKVGTKGNPVRIGQTVELEGTRYTVKSARKAPTVGGEFMQEKANGVYVIVELTIENKKNESKMFSDSASAFVAKDKTSYGTDSDATFAGMGDGEEPLWLTEMHPDLPVTGRLIFDVPPTKTNGGLLEVSDLFGGGEAYVALGLK